MGSLFGISVLLPIIWLTGIEVDYVPRTGVPINDSQEPADSARMVLVVLGMNYTPLSRDPSPKLAHDTALWTLSSLCR